MGRLILFKAEKGEISKYRQMTETRIGESFYRIANAGSVPSLTKIIAEHYDCSGGSIPDVGYRLTETLPEEQDSFRDNGWEVVRVEEYTPEIPAPYGAEFDSICLCYCVYKPLVTEDMWTKKAHRLAPSLDSFGGDEKQYKDWLSTQSEAMQTESRAVTAWLKTQEKQKQSTEV